MCARRDDCDERGGGIGGRGISAAVSSHLVGRETMFIVSRRSRRLGDGGPWVGGVPGGNAVVTAGEAPEPKIGQSPRQFTLLITGPVGGCRADALAITVAGSAPGRFDGFAGGIQGTVGGVRATGGVERPEETQEPTFASALHAGTPRSSGAVVVSGRDARRYRARLLRLEICRVWLG